EHGMKVTVASNGDDAIANIRDQVFDIVITDLNMPGKSGMEVLKAAKSAHPDTEVILITAYGTIDIAVEAMRLGASDFITKPFKLSTIERKVDKLLQESRRPESRAARTWIHPSVQHFVAASAQSKHLLRMIARIAPSNS